MRALISISIFQQGKKRGNENIFFRELGRVGLQLCNQILAQHKLLDNNGCFIELAFF